MDALGQLLEFQCFSRSLTLTIFCAIAWKIEKGPILPLFGRIGWEIMDKTAQLRLLGGCLAMGRFNSADLSRHTGVGANTVDSWLRRHADWFTVEEAGPSAERTSRGRPPLYRHLREDAEPMLRARLAATWRAISPTLHAPGESNALVGADSKEHFASIDAAERKLDAYAAARETGEEQLALQSLHSARTWIGLAWEDLDELAEAGTEIPSENLARLARLERRDPEKRSNLAFGSLADARTHLGRHMQQALDAGLPAQYAGAVLLARAGAHGENTVALLIGAALAEIAKGARKLAEPIIRTIPREEDTIKYINRLVQGAGLPKGVAQDDLLAVLSGIATDKKLSTDWRVGQCVFALRATIFWTPALAPTVMYLLVEAPNTTMDMLKETFAADLDKLFALPAAALQQPFPAAWELAERIWLRAASPDSKAMYNYWCGQVAA
jgi:hypothetical protein